MKERQEYIICAANWYQDLISPSFQPINIEKGIVICGHRHHNCMHNMLALTGLEADYKAGKSIQGFLTNTNRFVDRIEGAKIALESKQIEKLQFGKQLYSEDLY